MHKIIVGVLLVCLILPSTFGTVEAENSEVPLMIGLSEFEFPEYKECGSELIIDAKDTSHKVRFQLEIYVGGDIDLMYCDFIVFGMESAFWKWFETLTVKEINEKWGYIKVYRLGEVGKQVK